MVFAPDAFKRLPPEDDGTRTVFEEIKKGHEETDRALEAAERLERLIRSIVTKDRASVVASLRRREKLAERRFRRARGKNRIAAAAEARLLRRLQSAINRAEIIL